MRPFSPSPPLSQPPLTLKGALWMGALIVQCGLQPYLSKRFVPQNFDMGVFVFFTELLKIIFCFLVLSLNGDLKKSLEGWSVYQMFMVATPPSLIYTVQSILTQVGYKLADPLTANLLQQTKMITSAFFIWFLLGIRQTRAQIGALGGIFVGVFILSMNSSDGNGEERDSGSARLGAFYLLTCCLLSGLATGLVQKILWGRGRNSYLYSMELAAISLLSLMFSRMLNFLFSSGVEEKSLWEDPNDPSEKIFFLLPLFNSAIGGIIVGQVTAVVGGVWKGIALILGICFAGVFRYFVDHTPLSDTMFIAFPIIVLSSFIHVKNPPIPK